ncbi:hypothetical protein BJ742DRAFT_778226 [Cladochytrium replicatum]|nr:hypothetical protein BJ742DRAFT_778226 [Cladochytrium replicatum]
MGKKGGKRTEGSGALARALQLCQNHYAALARSPARRAPPEVLDAILDQLDKNGITAQTLVCVSWSNLARKKIWSRIDVDKTTLPKRRRLHNLSEEMLVKSSSSRLLPLSSFPITHIVAKDTKDGWTYETSAELGLSHSVTKVTFTNATNCSIDQYFGDHYDKFFCSFSRLTELEIFWPSYNTLEAPNSSAYPDALSKLSSLQHLKRLTVTLYRNIARDEGWNENGELIGDKGFSDIRGTPLCQSVEHLKIREKQIDYDILGLRSEFRSWSEHTLPGPPQSVWKPPELIYPKRDAFTEFLSKISWHRMEQLSLEVVLSSENKDLSECLYEKIGEQCRKLRSLRLYTAQYISENAFHYDSNTSSLLTLLTALPPLEGLHLRPTVSRWRTQIEFPEKQASLLRIFERHGKSHRSFSFGICSLFDSESLIALVEHCPNLEVLELDRIGELTVESVVSCVGMLPRLRELRLPYVSFEGTPNKFTTEHVDALAKHPRLKTIFGSFELCDSVEAEEMLSRRFELTS